MTKFYLFIIFICIVIILAIYLSNFNSKEIFTSDASIIEKNFVDKTVYSRSNSGINRGFQTSTNIPIAEKYIFSLNINNESSVAYYSTNTILAERFNVGQKVSVRYQKKNLFGFWKSIQVLDMELN